MKTRSLARPMSAILLLLAASVSCGGGSAPGEPSTSPDAGSDDAGSLDSGSTDASALREGPATLFVGNSYIFTNDVAGHYHAALDGLFDGATRVEEVSAGGYTLAQHRDDAQTDGTVLSRWLPDTIADGPFDVVVLQEQSQIGGFPHGWYDRRLSIDAAIALGSRAASQGASVVLYATWGRRDGDVESFTPTFETMQDALDDGYLRMAEFLRAEGVSVRVAPVGGAFRTIYSDLESRGVDPLATGSDFDALYEADGSHPSLRGAYLAACVLAGTVSGADPLSFVDEPALGPDISAQLRDACTRTLEDPRWEGLEQVAESAAIEPEPAMLDNTLFAQRVATDAEGGQLLVSGVEPHEVAVHSRADDGSWVSSATLRGPTGTEVAELFALSGDGSRAGVVWNGGTQRELGVFHRAAGEWMSEWALEADSISAIVLNESGDLLLVGNSRESSGDGIVRTFERTGADWREGPALTDPDSPSSAAYFGVSVALDQAGTRAIVGVVRDVLVYDPEGEVTSGSAHVFVRGDAGWTQEATLRRPDPVHWGGFGMRVALDADGTRAFVDSRVFARTGTEWTHEASLGLHGSFAIDGAGTRCLVGTPNLRDGTVHGYARTGTTWRLQSVLLPRMPAAWNGFGQMTALNRAGTRAIIASPNPRGPSRDIRDTGGPTVRIFDLPAP